MQTETTKLIIHTGAGPDAAREEAKRGGPKKARASKVKAGEVVVWGLAVSYTHLDVYKRQLLRAAEKAVFLRHARLGGDVQQAPQFQPVAHQGVGFGGERLHRHPGTVVQFALHLLSLIHISPVFTPSIRKGPSSNSRRKPARSLFATARSASAHQSSTVAAKSVQAASGKASVSVRQ